ncbi:hypothetical protein E3T19_00615 [Cryobacterium sp. TMT4-31]|nr:hypothetical protein E3T19_00615 [Cryobacterium sp. TMT4-31]
MDIVTTTRRRPWKGALIFSGVVLLATIAGVVFVPRERVLLEVGAMLAGLGVGAWLTRFGVPRPWIGSVVLVLFVAVCVILGSSGYAWFGGFFAGTLAGVAWGRAVANRTVQAAAPWTVDAKGFTTVEEARSAAIAALRSLDSKKSGRVSVEHGSARFEVAGGVDPGMVCHRNADSTDDDSWAVLQSAGVADESVEVPMGDVQGFMPARLVHDLASVETALADFLANPEASSFGPEWVVGIEAESTRLTTH